VAFVLADDLGVMGDRAVPTDVVAGAELDDMVADRRIRLCPPSKRLYPAEPFVLCRVDMTAPTRGWRYGVVLLSSSSCQKQ
jgi:hypothetical protein